MLRCTQVYGDWNRLHGAAAEAALRRGGAQPVQVEQVGPDQQDLLLLVVEHRPPAAFYLITGATCGTRFLLGGGNLGTLLDVARRRRGDARSPLRGVGPWPWLQSEPGTLL